MAVDGSWLYLLPVESHLLGRMNSADEAWLSLLLVALFGLLLFLDIKYQDSRNAETAVPVGATLLVFLIGIFFPEP